MRIDLLLDSGAFGAWRRGETIDPDKYIDYVKKNKQYIFAHVSLDTIPGGSGKSQQALLKEYDNCARKSYENHLYLKKAGLEPIPIFHQGESFTWLERYLNDKEPYIGISPYLRSSKAAVRRWLEKCFLYVTNKDGLPIVKTHGFGMTTAEFLFSFPWYSVDSTRWSLSSGYGLLPVPHQFPNGEYNYRKHLDLVLTHERTKRRTNAFDSFGPQRQKFILDYFEYAGLDLTRLRNDDHERRKAWLVFLRNLGKQSGRIVYAPGTTRQYKRPAVDIPSVRIFAAISPTSVVSNRGLNELNIRDRLTSYWDIKNKPDFVRCYSTTGMPSESSRKHNPKRYDDKGYEKVRRLGLVKRFGDSDAP
jgi:hypothetical protein